jgi:hypothetical protein
MGNCHFRNKRWLKIDTLVKNVSGYNATVHAPKIAAIVVALAKTKTENNGVY